MERYKIGVLQMDSGGDKASNLERIERMLGEAVAEGAAIVSLPEFMNIISGKGGADSAEPVPGHTTGLLCRWAKQHGIWIHGGSILEDAPGGKPFNTTVVVSPDGEILASYRKLHLFFADIPGGVRVRESDHMRPGGKIVSLPTPLGHLGLSICYDLRFPELYRLLALRGAQVLFVPASFTDPTGEAHWEPLLRARAIENGCYVVAAAQCGEKPKYLAHGNSLVVDPWGKIIARAGRTEGVLLAEINLDLAEKARRQIPALETRRPDVYTLEGVGAEPQPETQP